MGEPIRPFSVKDGKEAYLESRKLTSFSRFKLWLILLWETSVYFPILNFLFTVMPMVLTCLKLAFWGGSISSSGGGGVSDGSEYNDNSITNEPRYIFDNDADSSIEETTNLDGVKRRDRVSKTTSTTREGREEMTDPLVFTNPSSRRVKIPPPKN